MHVKSILLKNFRNIASQEIEPNKRINVYSGDNAQGKTNFLEALYYVNKGRSFRTSRDKNLIKWNEKYAYIAAELSTRGKNFLVEIGISSDGGKLFKINNKKCSYSQMFSLSGTVLFTPEDLFLVKGAPQQRRAFLDNEIGPSFKEYVYYLRQYKYTLEQRNNLIRNIARNRKDLSTIDVWDEQLAGYGSKLIRHRLFILKELSNEVNLIHVKLSGGERIAINYLSSFNLTEKLKEEIIKKDFLSALQKKREEELFRQQTLIGPHRDDLKFVVNGMDARDFASQGQQRTIVLTLKLSLIKVMSKWHGDFPVLLLDDVLFELDGKRRKFLLRELEKDIQVFLTTNNTECFSAINRENIQYYVVDSGIIKERG